MTDRTETTGRILMLEDRYGGVYSNGAWLGVIDADARHEDNSRGGFVVSDGPSGGDMIAAAFWDEAPEWIVAGRSPKHVMDLIAAKGVLPRHD